jgi:hypothetical protein
MKKVGQQYYGANHWDMWKPCFMISPRKNKIIEVTFIPAQEKMMELGYRRISIWSNEVRQYKNKVQHQKQTYVKKCLKHKIPMPKEKRSALWTWIKLTIRTY